VVTVRIARTTRVGDTGSVFDEAWRQLLIVVPGLARGFNAAAALRSSPARLANR
jgi:predicted phosphoribosyltransferase